MAHEKKNKPIAVQIDAGKHFFCRCGQSQDFPFCDGSHKGTDFVPKKLFFEQPTQAYICGCDHSKKFPFCDGSHKQIQAD